MKKKIMHITQANGGVARYLQMLFKYMDKNKYEQILIYPNEYIYEENDFINLVDKIEFMDMFRNIDLINDIKSIFQLYKLIKKHDPDLIYVHSSKAGALGRIANMFIRKPIIYNPHGWAFNMDVSKQKQFVYKFIEKVLEKQCDKIIAISDQEKKAAIEKKICKEDKIQVIFNGIDIQEYENSIIDKDQFKISHKIPKDSLVIGMVGRISKQKAPDVFINVAAKIKAQIPNAFFIIVGDGDQRSEIEELIKELGLQESVLITGWVKNIYEYIQSFDIAMLLSRWEGFGLAIAEYMICEVAVIATNVDAIPNIINDNENGVLVNVDDVNGIVDACKKILGDKNFRLHIVNNARNLVLDKFDVERVACEHEKLINLKMNI